MRQQLKTTGLPPSYRTMAGRKPRFLTWLARFHRATGRLGWAWLDLLPPYRRVEGRLDAKEVANDGSFYILVDSRMVEVDWLTHDTLMVGEALRIRATRSFKAVSIDRLVP